MTKKTSTIIILRKLKRQQQTLEHGEHWELPYTVNGTINTNILENKFETTCKVENVHNYGPGILLCIYFRKTHIQVH